MNPSFHCAIRLYYKLICIKRRYKIGSGHDKKCKIKKFIIENGI